MSKPKTVEEYWGVLQQFVAGRDLNFNPDMKTVWPLVEGLWENKRRYGYASCPCRLACEDIEKDKDIVCPCAYAPADIEEYGQCYCGLYVHTTVANGNRALQEVPERRPADKMCL
jgi:ferredoxin-thioredoxin reductase catalytic subunit